MHNTLRNLLQEAIADVSHADVHDRALFYLRLLQYDIQKAKAILTQKSSSASHVQFPENISSQLEDQLFEAFNTLSVVYERVLVTNPTKKMAIPVQPLLGSKPSLAWIPPTVTYAVEHFKIYWQQLHTRANQALGAADDQITQITLTGAGLSSNSLFVRETAMNAVASTFHHNLNLEVVSHEETEMPDTSPSLEMDLLGDLGYAAPTIRTQVYEAYGQTNAFDTPILLRATFWPSRKAYEATLLTETANVSASLEQLSQQLKNCMES